MHNQIAINSCCDFDTIFNSISIYNSILFGSEVRSKYVAIGVEAARSGSKKKNYTQRRIECRYICRRQNSCGVPGSEYDSSAGKDQWWQRMDQLQVILRPTQCGNAICIGGPPKAKDTRQMRPANGDARCGRKESSRVRYKRWKCILAMTGFEEILACGPMCFAFSFRSRSLSYAVPKMCRFLATDVRLG